MEIFGGIFLIIVSVVWGKIGSALLSPESIFNHPLGLTVWGIPCVIVAIIGIGTIWIGFSEMNNRAEYQERRKKQEENAKMQAEITARPYKDIYYNSTEFESLKQKAQSGDAKAQFILSGVYFLAAHENDLGNHWVKKAADNGHEGAIKLLAEQQRRAQNQAELNRWTEQYLERQQFIKDVEAIRKGHRLY